MLPMRYQWTSVFAIVFFVSILAQETASQSPDGGFAEFHRHKAGNFTIAGLFPIHVRGCEDAKFRTYLMALSEAMVFAVEEINKDPSLLPNVTLGYDIHDSCLVVRRAMKAALKFVNVNTFAFAQAGNVTASSCGGILADGEPISPISAVIGTGNSGSSILVSNLLNVERIPLISYAATSDELSSSAYPTFLRAVPPDRFQSRAMAEIAHHFNWTYVGAIAIDTSYGQSGIEEFSKSCAQLGICVAYENFFPAERSNENIDEKIKLIVSELIAKPEVKVIVLYSTPDEVKRFFREGMRQGLTGRTWIASEAWGTKVIPPELLPIAQGTLGIVFPDDEVSGFKKHLMAKTSAYRPAGWWRHFWEREFDCEFGNASHPCSDDLGISEELYVSARLHDRKSAFVIDAVYAVAHSLDAAWRRSVHHGNANTLINTKDVLTYLKKVNFTQFNRSLSFDENGDPVTSSYSIINLQPDNGTLKVKQVGTWMDHRSPPLQLDNDSLVWTGGSERGIPQSVCQEPCQPGHWQTRERACCWECIRCAEDTISTQVSAPHCSPCPENSVSNSERTRCIPVPVEHIGYSDPLGILFVLLSGAGVGFTAWCSYVFYEHKNTPIVKASNRELSYMLLFCIAMCYATPILYLAEPGVVVCPANQAWFYLFYTACVAILGAKTNRIVHLFESRVPRSALTKYGWVRKYRHVVFVAGVAAMDLLIITAWIVSDPPVPHVDKSLRLEYYKLCKLTSGVAGDICQYLLMGFLIFISICCCYFAYRSRKLPHNFNEAKFIAFSFYILVLSWVTFYPVYLNIQGLYTVVVSCAATVIAATGLLVCIFVPKVYIILRQPEKNTVAYMKAQITDHTFRKSVAGTRDRNSSILQQNSSNNSPNPALNRTTHL